MGLAEAAVSPADCTAAAVSTVSQNAAPIHAALAQCDRPRRRCRIRLLFGVWRA